MNLRSNIRRDCTGLRGNSILGFDLRKSLRDIMENVFRTLSLQWPSVARTPKID